MAERHAGYDTSELMEVRRPCIWIPSPPSPPQISHLHAPNRILFHTLDPDPRPHCPLRLERGHSFNLGHKLQRG